MQTVQSMLASCRTASTALVSLLFALTLALSAMLLFLAEPALAKALLPPFGGAPAVWNTALLFFQAALLAGYVYAHVVASRVPFRMQLPLHAAILGIATLTLPVGLAMGWTPDGSVPPVLSIVIALAGAAGLPFVLVSATAPLLQSWFARSNTAGASDPYFLYAASNAGSLIALLAYPSLFEPFMDLGSQFLYWSAGFLILCALVMACGMIVLLSPRLDAPAAAASEDSGERLRPVSPGRRLRWVALSFVPSSLLLGVTSHITTDIAPVPLLWVLPLLLYLLTFILSFGSKSFVLHRWNLRAAPYVLICFAVFQASPGTHALLSLGINLVLFFVLALMCHGELARDRPSSSRLTEFYLLISIGGLLGGIFNAIVAPLVFSDLYEYPLAIVFACLLRPGGKEEGFRSALWTGAAMLAAGVAVTYAAQSSAAITAFLGMGLLAFLSFAWHRQSLRFALAMGALLASPFIAQAFNGTRLSQTRSFFGAYTISDENAGQLRTMRHGTTLHGSQSTDASRRLEPLTYYWRQGPAGEAISSLAPLALQEVGVAGLGTGSMSCYRKEGQAWSFFEIDPSIVAMVQSGRYFTFVRSCAASARFVAGDARLSLGTDRPHRYGLLVLDAFSSDAIPVHLLTREAFTVYDDKLMESGVILANISNRYLDFSTLVASLASEKGMTSFVKEFTPSKAEAGQGAAPSIWMAASRNRDFLAKLASYPGWRKMEAIPGYRVWTDGYSNILGVLRW